MNSEELELSLRTEFEDYLKNVFADMQQEVAQFQKKIEADFEKHRSQLDQTFQEFSARFVADKALDAGFKDTVVEHLRLARDEGAKLTAEAFAKAEEMEKEFASEQVAFDQPVSEQPVSEKAKVTEVSIGFLRNAINEISKQTSQATVLQTLVEHAERFAPRGAFFIVKNDNFVGWRVFGQDAEVSDEVVREVSLPLDAASVLGESVRSLSAVETAYGTFEDAAFLEPLGFGEPEKMIAIPLVARGRGVAVLYADSMAEGKNINVEALETLLCVAGLTVEVLASAPSARPAAEAVQAPEYIEETVEEIVKEVDSPEYYKEFDDSALAGAEEYQASQETKDFETIEESREFETLEEYKFSAEELAANDFQDSFREDDFSAPNDFESEPLTQEFVVDDSSIKEIDVEKIQPAESLSEEYLFEKDKSAEDEEISAEEFSQLGFSEDKDEQIPQFDVSTLVSDDDFSADDEIFTPKQEESFGLPAAENGKAESFAAPVAIEQVAETVSAKPARSRLSDRNVDLPIEVTEDERRLHNDARRFARLLVSEIKLYNEQKVKEGREARDLYDRLREAIDRSREMYDKRVQPPVAAKFDYFHYELVSSLAAGEENSLGGGYPGSAI